MTTLGQWKVDDDGSIRTTDGRDVVTAFDHRVVVTDTDARLIAAAPDLLAACEALARSFDAVAYAAWTPEMHAAVAAIAKAKGGTK